ncbi:hypothetical protein H5410_023109 [Solanum commersonii]|uniref:Uncharacterized protein n=1 Tax=Solanum commersonii TaxID=4109 RepID=A0A9J5ZJ52_SOLCO|nr:hypothetical protein H5410_023079 [Solanum commersonii]KAG5611828.1 hypothetical protein H5410_023109 [Solanum commersonii]
MQSSEVLELDIICRLPTIATSNKVLVFNVNEILSSTNGTNVCIVDTLINDDVLSSNKAYLSSFFGVYKEVSNNATINRPKYLNILATYSPLLLTFLYQTYSESSPV